MHMYHLDQRGSRFRLQRLSILCCDEEIWLLTAVLFSGLRHSPTLRQDICQFFFSQFTITVSLRVLRMYASYFTHMRSRTTLLVYFKFCALIGGFSWATRDWARGWNSRQDDGVKTRRTRHLQRSCPLDNHSRICQLSMLSTWLIAWVLLRQNMPILLLWCGISVDKHFTLFNPGIQRCPSDSGVSVHEVAILILMAMHPGCFGFQHPSRF